MNYEHPFAHQPWKSMTAIEKYAAFSRWSTVLSTPMVWLILIIPLFTNASANGIPTYARVTFTLVSATLTIWAAITLAHEPTLKLNPEEQRRSTPPTSLIATGVVWALFLILRLLGPEQLTPWIGNLAFFCLFLFSYAHAAWLPYKWWITTALTALTCTVTWPTFYGPAYLWPFIPFFFLAITLLALWSIQVLREAMRAQQLDAELKVSEERVRIAQELHDTMGQHLAAMSLKTQVALTLVERGDERAAAELRELQDLMKTSTADMRDVVHGYRHINLATEISGARSLLESSNVRLSVDGDSFYVPESHRESAAWFIREATTNILKHSSATEAHLTLNTRGVTMKNNGATHFSGAISGLGQLRRRLAEGGARLTLEHVAPHFTVALYFDERVVGAETKNTPTIATHAPRPLPSKEHT